MPGAPVNCAVGIFVEITGEEAATTSFTWLLRLLRADETIVSVANQEVSTSGVSQASRLSDDIVVVMNQAVTFYGLALEPGTYHWDLLLNGEASARRAFLVTNLPG